MKNEIACSKILLDFGINLNQIDFYITDYADVWDSRLWTNVLSERKVSL